jgi:hypothetical protein
MENKVHDAIPQMKHNKVPALDKFMSKFFQKEVGGGAGGISEYLLAIYVCLATNKRLKLNFGVITYRPIYLLNASD